jgi:hypothetical protein
MATRQTPVKERKPRKRSRGPVLTTAALDLKKLHAAVRADFATATDLPTFLATVGELTNEQRKVIVRQALVLIEQNYAHLPLKRAMHSIEPVQRLKLLLQRLELAPPEEQPTETEFHREMTDTFTSLRDLHTNYLLPAPYNGMTAFLPFMVEEYFESEQGKPRYLVSHLAQGFQHPTFVRGVEVVYWNGMPIERAVLNNAQRYAGSNRAARHARGVQTLTTRVLRVAFPPDEEWVVVGYRTDAGKLEEVRVDWMVAPAPPSWAEEAQGPAPGTALLGIDLEQDILQRVRKVLFAPQVVEEERNVVRKLSQGEAFGALESTFPHIFEARPVTTPAGTFGYLRIRTFSPDGELDDFVREFIRLITALPQNGLILDVRGNGGGIVTAGELLLQTLTPRRIEPEPVQFINTPLNLEICRRHGPASTWADLSSWVESMQQALQTGATFSAGFPLSDPEACNKIGQKYFGPVVLITDALCYSTTDIFCAGFQDHEIGTILGTADYTGAGGANVWEQRYFVSYVFPGAGSAYQPLPNGAGLRVAIRRTLRVGRRAGSPVEDLGVFRDVRHHMTRNDLLQGNIDLIAKAASLLAPKPARRLTVTVQATTPTQLAVVIETQGMTRLDVYLAERPLQSIDVQDGQFTVALTKTDPGSAILEIRGFDGKQLVARYRTDV